MKTFQAGTITLCAALMLAVGAAKAQFRAPVDMRSTGEQLSQDPMFQQQLRQAARQAAEDQQQSNRDTADAEKFSGPLEQRLRNASPGFNAYVDARFAKEPGEKRYHSGSRDWTTTPWNPAQRVQMLGKFRADYDHLSASDREAWEQAVPGTTLSNTSLQTGSLGGSLLPHRPSSFASPAPQPAPGGGWLSDAILNSNSPASAAPTVVTVEQSQAAAVKKYPALAVAGSPLNREFVARVKGYRTSAPAVFNDPGWPGKVADESLAAIAAGTIISK